MKAMLLNHISDFSTPPLQLSAIDRPVPARHDVLIEIHVCGVCHTELDEIEGRAMPAFFPIVPGHQVVGTVVECGADATRFRTGDRVGVGWIYSACGECEACLRGEENLCDHFIATGKDVHGGYAEFMAVDERFAVPIPAMVKDSEAAPLLCAGAIGYRSLRLTNLQDGQSLGLAGFGASAHLVIQLVASTHPGSRVAVFVRSAEEQAFAKQLGADWTGTYDELPPYLMDAVIDTTPAWKPIVKSLSALKPGGRLVINAIRKEDGDKDSLLELSYHEHLWMEREIKTVANLTHADIAEFIPLAGKIPLRPEVTVFPLERANEALQNLRRGGINGANVLKID